jgi:hypothetical protein
MTEDKYPHETLELIYNEVKDRLNTQFQSLDGCLQNQKLQKRPRTESTHGRIFDGR